MCIDKKFKYFSPGVYYKEGITTYRCKRCGKMFEVESEYQKHIRSNKIEKIITKIKS